MADYGLIASLVLRVGRNNREVLAVKTKKLTSKCLSRELLVELGHTAEITQQALMSSLLDSTVG